MKPQALCHAHTRVGRRMPAAQGEGAEDAELVFLMTLRTLRLSVVDWDIYVPVRLPMARRTLFCMTLILLAAACGGAPATDVPAAQSTARTTRGPQATFTPVPTSTPAAPTATPTVTPTPDPTADLCPLTGLKDTARPWTTRRPLAVKIDNSPQARPQSALLQADVIFEHLAEGGISRFDVVFWCSGSENAGPVRSARIIDFDIIAMLQAILVHVGASDRNLARLRETFGNRLIDGDVDKPLLRRSTDRIAPYNAYINTSTIWDAASKRGANAANLVLKGLVFSDGGSLGGKPATHVDVPMDPRFSLTTWDYDATRKLYKKSLFGTAFLDASGAQVAMQNMVVLFAKHSVTDVIEDSLGSRSIQIDLHGRGRAVLFRDGQAFEGEWVREEPNAMLRIVDATGQDVALKTGHTWFEVVPTDLNLAFK